MLVKRSSPPLTSMEQDARFVKSQKAMTAYTRSGYFSGAWFQHWAAKLNPRELSPRAPYAERHRHGHGDEEDY